MPLELQVHLQEADLELQIDVFEHGGIRLHLTEVELEFRVYYISQEKG